MGYSNQHPKLIAAEILDHNDLHEKTGLKLQGAIL